MYLYIYGNMQSNERLEFNPARRLVTNACGGKSGEGSRGCPLLVEVFAPLQLLV